MRVALLGVGAIGGYILDGIAQGAAGPVQVVALADQAARADAVRPLAERHGAVWTADPLELPQHHPDVVIEAASQQVVRQYALPLLERGVDLMLLSIGALADPSFLARVAETAARAGRRVHLPSGALGGLDVLRAARIGGLDEVILRTSKPPRALAGAPYFDQHPVDFERLTGPTIVFEGSALEAVQHFPANVNVAATVSLAGIGPAATRVQVVADPTLAANVHEVTARGAFGEMSLRLANLPSPANPRTSLLACLSPLATLRRLSEPIQIG
jgi:aspartate dehydrogenase